MQKSATRNEIPVESAIPFSTSLQKRAGQQGLLLSQGDTHTQTHIYYLNFEKQKTLKMQFHLLHHLTQTVKALKKLFKKKTLFRSTKERILHVHQQYLQAVSKLMDVNTDFACKFATLLSSCFCFCIHMCNTSEQYSKEYTSTRLDPILLIIRRWQLHMFALCATVVMQQSMPSVTRLDKQ